MATKIRILYKLKSILNPDVKLFKIRISFFTVVVATYSSRGSHIVTEGVGLKIENPLS